MEKPKQQPSVDERVTSEQQPSVDEPTSLNQLPSIHDIEPLEKGGVYARQGFEFQDHVAACFCLDMLDKKELLQVECETHDDITLIWQQSSGKEVVEFVQVKGATPDKLWTVAQLCESGQKKQSILKKSLMNDRVAESCIFRLVTARDVHSQLKPLTFPLDSRARGKAKDKLHQITQDILNRLKSSSSPNKHSPAFWVDHVVWQVRHSKEAVKDANLLQLERLLEKQGCTLTSEQKHELYNKILKKVYEAANASSEPDPSVKKIRRGDFFQWFKEQTNALRHPVQESTGKKLKRKMHEASISPESIESAQEARMLYLQERRTPRYLDTLDLKMAEGEVQAELQLLRSQLEAGTLADNGVEFHSRCLQRLSELKRQNTVSTGVSNILLQGIMYCITDRCRHRFVKHVKKGD